jgi:hypothetical protein
LSDQAERSEGAEAGRLSSDAVAACKSALTVWTAEDFPYYHNLATRSPARAEEALRKVKP